MPKHSKANQEKRAENLSAKIEAEASIKTALQRVRVVHRSIESNLEKALDRAEKETAESRLEFMGKSR